MPYHKESGPNTSSLEQAYRDSVRPFWGPDGVLLYGMPSKTAAGSSGKGGSPLEAPPVIEHKASLVSEGNDVRYARLNVGKVCLGKRFLAVHVLSGIGLLICIVCMRTVCLQDTRAAAESFDNPTG
jgi:hypothetical protein